jgi:hypothetical protein
MVYCLFVIFLSDVKITNHIVSLPSYEGLHILEDGEIHCGTATPKL